jgi:hypothetical protein
MNFPPIFTVLRWLIRDTFAQARASGILWLMLTVSTICIVLCLSVGVSGGTTKFARGETREFVPPTDPTAQDPTALERHGVEAPRGEITLLFGAFRIPFNRYREENIHFLELLLAGGVADAAGILLVLVWTAGFLPGFLDGSRVAVLLAKPSPRWLLLLGKYVGVVVFVFAQTALFVGGTWLALGIKTGVWDLPYLLCIPILVFQFAVFFSFSLLLAVCFRSTVVCVFGSILFWFLCWGANFARHLLAAWQIRETAARVGPAVWAWGGPHDTVTDTAFALEVALRTPAPAANALPLSWSGEFIYWILPKPVDLGMILFDALRAEGYFSRTFDPKSLADAGFFLPGVSAASSLLFAVVVLGLSVYEFNRADY